ncbi:SGNH/GDSL hydrolase family protein [Actinokineospora iranica]|uniref:GDSL-like Lipase/Acylhydrolase family protein n=1 Tax=Actinokineospora iranica TaxID=1271860 RepID=A0A1G6J669_9PSEU|nr:SGNH/GDSL hydrolase family protein [Actinokineospora iranica]SDC14354.1 GDSL-like Lipase/Acylhydrolase family protein [Actinokineospora iranica]
MRVRGPIAVAAAAATAAGLMLTWGPGAQAADPLKYVALGDSAAAGPLIPNQTSLACLRSDRNYPAVVAKTLGATLTDVSCSGAELTDFSVKQSPSVPPQYDALTADTDLVTITIGGNDVDLVTRALTCINLLPEPIGFSCADRFTAGGKDAIAAAITAWTPKLGAALDEIHTRAPKAEVVVVGYGTYIRNNGCYPTQPIWARDANYIQGSINKLNATLRAQAEAHGATFVDIAGVSVGHDTCAAPADRYLEGLFPTSPAAPLHPNATGMAAFGAAVAAAVTANSHQF